MSITRISTGLAGAIFSLLMAGPAAAQQNESILELQTLLNDKGCDAGAADGLWGNKTKAALGRLQAKLDDRLDLPVTAEALGMLRASVVQCDPRRFPGLSPRTAAARLEAAELRAWNPMSMRSAARRNPSYCEPWKYDTPWVGFRGSVVLQREISIHGEDLSKYASATDPIVAQFHRLNALAARSGDNAELKAFLLEIARNDHFTELTAYRPKRWEGHKPDWIESYGKYRADAESAFSGSILLVPASIALSLVGDELKQAELEVIRAWGRKLYLAITAAKRTAMGTREGRDGSADIRAAYAAGFLSWGAAAQDIEAFRKGAALFEEGVRQIRRDGSERRWIDSPKSHPGLELKYQNFTYGLLTVAAHVLHMNGIEAYQHKAANRGSLLDGLAFHLTATYDPSKRIRMQEMQQMHYQVRAQSSSDHTLAYLEFADNAGLLTSMSGEIVTQAMKNRDVYTNKGFYGGFFGGFTSCLFAR